MELKKGLSMQSIVINVKDSAIDKVLNILQNLSDIEIVDKSSKTDERWIYWQDEELDNFGKIAIGLSKHDYDDEDYSKW